MQIILDLSNYQNYILIRRVTYSNNPKLVEEINISNDTFKLFLVTNTHEGAKKVESFDEHLKKLKMEKIFNAGR